MGLDMFEIRKDDLSSEATLRLLALHLAGMHANSPPGSVNALDLSGLKAPGTTFWSVWDGAEVVGIGALKELSDGSAEVKSMRTSSTRKRSGVASLLLEHIITQAREMGFTRLSLETGSAGFFAPARGLYEKFGFTYCGPFGDYRPDPNSVFLTRTL